MSAPRKKLIEVSLPLEVINREAERDTPKLGGHPWRMHYWWARRKLPVARAVLFAQLVDDPSSHPEKFPDEAAQKAERERLHNLIERLVVWDNVRDPELLNQAFAEIARSCGDLPPRVLDPFAGGGTIPLEAQRLGLEAQASDINPVAVLINKALIEIPPRFRDQAPVSPGLAGTQMDWTGAEGLAADIKAYGAWMRIEAERRIGDHYPSSVLADGTEVPVIAWIWARTIECPNPTCGIQMPLVRSWWLSSKKGKEVFVTPSIHEANGGRHVKYTVTSAPRDPNEADGTVNRNGALCVACGTAVPLSHVRQEGRDGRISQVLMAVVAEGERRRIYLSPNADHVLAADVERPVTVPIGELPRNPRDFKTPNYGMTDWADLFTNRQLLGLTTFSDLAVEARNLALRDALDSGQPRGDRLDNGGSGAEAYADAIACYLGLSISRCADYQSSITTWHHRNQQIRNVFARQAIPMAWDFLEVNPLVAGHGTCSSQIALIAGVLERLECTPAGTAQQSPALPAGVGPCVISTDPPYYDNVAYADLSDFFYVWLRRTLRTVFPDLLSTMLVPKQGELVANAYRLGGKDDAKEFFEDGFRNVFQDAHNVVTESIPITVYYAFKQSESASDGDASTGWETLLEGMIRSNWMVTSTWPFRTEKSSRMLSQGNNVLASSIVLSLRPRSHAAPTVDRRGLIAALQSELPGALRSLQQGTIAPVDLPQAAIGPGMAVFSRYSSVIEDDGSPMSVRSALARINEILDQVLNEQEGDFDATTRFCLAWYRQHGYSTGQFGQADDLARARNTAVDAMDRAGVLTSRAGRVTLLAATDLPADYDVVTDEDISVWETLHHTIRVLESDGVPAAGAFLAASGSRKDGGVELDLVKELAFLLFSVAEKHKWTKDALSFNSIATSWPDIIEASRGQVDATASQAAFDYTDEED